MKALVLEAYHHLMYQEVLEPVPGPGEVLVQIQASGICGSDVHGLDGSSGRRIPPLIMGHEAAGVIVGAGSDVEGWQPGDRVTFDSTIYCGACHFCRQGRINLCDNRRVLGVSCQDYRQDGTFAEYVAVPQHIVYRLPEEVSFVQAAMVEPVSIAVHAVGRAPIRLNDTALVVGAGMIGLLVIQALRAAGCGRIMAIDLDPGRLALARRLGADVVLQSGEKGQNQADLVAEVQVMTEGRGADLAFEVVGISPTLELATLGLRKGGSLVLVGNLSPKTEFLSQSVVTRELTLYGSCASQGEYAACLEMIAHGTIDVDSFVSAVVPLKEGPAWFERLYQREPGLMKIILEP
ncbi:MAG: galactitol-1-phosphate 5-dehydrogenase [Anaerolineae bacterium]|jgi:L-iditol 2-dehydrogenase